MIYYKPCDRCDATGDGCPVCLGTGRIRYDQSAFHDRRARRGHYRAMGRAIAWLRSVGIAVQEAPAPAGCFFPGVWYQGGGLACDPRVAYVGDLLHDAGHLAVLPERMRVRLGVGSVFSREVLAERERIAQELDAAVEAGGDHPLYWVIRAKGEEESAAQAWSLAACDAACVDPWRVFDMVTFYTPGKVGPEKNAGLKLRTQLWSGKHPGVLALAENGMTTVRDYPDMKRWLA